MDCDLAGFQGLLVALLKRENGGCQESVYEGMKAQNVSAVVALHFANLFSFADANLTALSIILLKHIYQVKELASRVDGATNELVCKQLPLLFRDEHMDKHLLEILVDACATIVPWYMQNGMMFDFLTMLMELIASDDCVRSAMARNCLAQLHVVAPQCVEMSEEYVFNAVARGLEVKNEPEMTLATIRMLFEFYQSPSGTPALGSFAPAVASLYRVMPPDWLPSALNELFRFCLNKYYFFQSTLNELVESLVGIVTNNVSEPVNIFAIETLICLAKNYDCSFVPFLQPVTAVCMAASAQVTEEDVAEENFPFADDAVFHLSEIFSEKTMYPTMVVRLAKEMVSKPTWQCKRAGLVALHRLIASCGDTLETEFTDLCNIICPLMKDENPVLRINAYSAFRKLCSLQGALVGTVAQSFVESTVAVLKIDTVSQSRLAALKALDEFCKNCPSAILVHASEQLMAMILEFLKQKLEPQEQIAAIRCMTSISTSTQCPFEQFYVAFLPLLKAIYSNRPPGNDDPTRLQVIQAMPVVFKAVPPALYQENAVEFMKSLLEIGMHDLGDLEKETTLDAFGKMADLSTELFLQFLPMVMGLLSSIISSEIIEERLPLSCDVSRLTDRVWKQLPAENSVTCYHRSQLQVIMKAMEIMKTLASTFTAPMAQMVEHIDVSVMAYLTFDAYPPIQKLAIQLLKSLIPVYRVVGGDRLGQFLMTLRQRLIEALTMPFTTAVRCSAIVAMTTLIDTVAELQIPIPDLLGPIIAAVNVIIVQSGMRRKYILERQSQSGLNTTDMLAEDDFDYALSLFARCCLKHFPTETFPSAGPWLSMSADLFRMLLLAELLAIKPDPAAFAQLSRLIHTSMSSESMNRIRFAFIVFSRFVSNFEPSVIQSVTECAITTITQFEDDEDYCTHLAIDGALVAVSTSIKGGLVTDPSVLSLWLSQLPLISDFDEASIVYETLLQLLADKNPIILNNESIPKLLKIAGTVMRQSHLPDTLKDAFRSFVRALTPDLIKGALLELAIPDRIEIQRILS